MTTVRKPDPLWAVVACSLLLMLLAACTSDSTTTPSPTTPPTVTLPASPTPTVTPTATATPGPAGPEFLSEDCWIDTPAAVETECGTVNVPHDWAREDGETYELAVAVLRSLSESPRPDPVVYLAGGPGENALDTLIYVYEDLFAAFVEERDVVIFDQRGAGYSEPYAECPELDELTIEQLDDVVNDDASIDEAGRRMVAAANACFDSISTEGVDLTTLATANSARDAQAIMRALGYDEWNVLGVSYGTRLAQTIMRDVPEGVRAVVLDSVVPLEADLYAQTPGSFARALQAMFDACAEDAVCSGLYPGLEDDFFETVDLLNEVPLQGSVADQTSGEIHSSVATGVSLADLVFQGLYSPEVISVLPEAIAMAKEGNSGWIDLLRGINLANAEFISTGMHFGLQCQEEAAFTSEARIAEATMPHEDVRRMLEGSRPIGSEILDVCAHWGLPAAPNIENQPVESAIPTLVLAGRFDPITPPEGSRTVAERLANATYVEFPNAGHAALTAGECAASTAVAFLADPAGEVAAACVEGLSGIAWARPLSQTEFEPFESAEAGVRGIAPTGWVSPIPGAFSRTDLGLPSVVQMITPGVRGVQMTQLVAASLPGAPDAVDTGTITVQATEWRTYEIDVAGQSMVMAYAGTGVSVPFVMVSGLSGQSSELREFLLTPVLEAIEPL